MTWRNTNLKQSLVHSSQSVQSLQDGSFDLVLAPVLPEKWSCVWHGGGVRVHRNGLDVTRGEWIRPFSSVILVPNFSPWSRAERELPSLCCMSLRWLHKIPRLLASGRLLYQLTFLRSLLALPVPLSSPWCAFPWWRVCDCPRQPSVSASCVWWYLGVTDAQHIPGSVSLGGRYLFHNKAIF